MAGLKVSVESTLSLVLDGVMSMLSTSFYGMSLKRELNIRKKDIHYRGTKERKGS